MNLHKTISTLYVTLMQGKVEGKGREVEGVKEGQERVQC
jgi:hypothetical protein